MKTYNHEPDRYGPRICLDYDPMHRRWNHPPPRWLWWYRPEPKHTRLDTIAGIVGGTILAATMYGLFFWHPWL
jgi:hypothetical protein